MGWRNFTSEGLHNLSSLTVVLNCCEVMETKPFATLRRTHLLSFDSYACDGKYFPGKRNRCFVADPCVSFITGDRYGSSPNWNQKEEEKEKGQCVTKCRFFELFCWCVLLVLVIVSLSDTVHQFWCLDWDRLFDGKLSFRWPSIRVTQEAQAWGEWSTSPCMGNAVVA